MLLWFWGLHALKAWNLETIFHGPVFWSVLPFIWVLQLWTAPKPRFLFEYIKAARVTATYKRVFFDEMKTHNFTAPADHDDYYHMSLQALYAIQNDEGIEHPRQVLQEVHNLNALEDCSMIVAQNPEAFSRNVFFDLLLDPFRSAAGGERIMSEEERQQEWEEYLHDTHPDDFENHHSSAWTEISPRVLLLGIRRRGGPGKSRRVTVLC